MVIRSIVRLEAPDAVATPAAPATLGPTPPSVVIVIVMSRRDAAG
jgi:hypothetical protein